MATFNERIQVVIDVVTDKATKGFGDFRKAVSDANGFTGKLKAGVSSLGGAFIGAATSPAGLIAGVGAAAKVAIDAVQQYSDLGIAIDNFATATGLSLDAASRLYEVTGDLGGSTDALQTALNKMNKATDPKVFADLGIAMAQTNTGAQDVAGTFLNVIDHLNAIKDPTERAKQGTLLFGKAWTSLAPLIAAGADKIRKNMEGVADVKVFDKDKVAQTRKFQEAQAALNDSIEELSLTLGQELVPALTNTIGPIANLVGSFQTLKESMGTAGLSGLEMSNQLSEWVGGWFSDASTEIEYTGQAITNMGDAAGGSARYLGLLADQQKRVSDNSFSAKDSLDAARDSLKKYQDQIKGRNDLVKLVTDLDDISNKLNEITMLHEADLISDRDYWLQSATLTGEAQQAVSDYLDTVDGIPPLTKKKLLIEFDPNAPSKFLTDLQTEVDRKKIRVPVFPGFVMPGPQDGPNTDPKPPVEKPKPPLPPVEEPKPQPPVRQPGQKERMLTGNVTINVAVPPGYNQYEFGKAVYEALLLYNRNTGG